MIQEWINAYQEFERKNEDPRTKGWFLVGSPVDGVVICLIYVFVVTILGPRFMKNREPFNIRRLMVVYNFAMVLLSAYMVYLFVSGGWFRTYSFGCQPVDMSRTPAAMNMVLGSYLFYVSKYIEFLDTIFFILRKKFHQVTFLHVWHHAVMPASWITAPKFAPGGMATFSATLNSFVHVCMYTYYGISAMGPEYQKYVWWKKYMTKLQIAQFVVIIAHASQSFFIECEFPFWINYWLVGFSLIFLILFSNFYIQAYIKKLRAQKATSTKSASNGTAVCDVSHGHQNGVMANQNGGIHASKNGEHASKNGEHASMNGDHISNGLSTKKFD